jgi:diguanylate cyclase (GGDEF)-like protein
VDAPDAHEPPSLPDVETFLRVARLLNSSLDLDTVLRQLLDGLDRLLRPTHWSLLLIDERTGELVFTLARGQAGGQLLEHRLAPNEGIAGWVAAHDEALLIPDVSTDPRFSSRMDHLSGFRTRSIVAVPLRPEGRCVGVIELVNALDARVFTETDVAILRSFADFAAIAIHNARRHAALVEMSRDDPLTGLRNATYFVTRLEEAIAAGAPFAVVFFDMDHFKALVDTHGHVRGSAALAEVGSVLRAALHEDDVACRFGGDEFALLLPRVDRAAAEVRCRALEALIDARRFLEVEGIAAHLGASFGVAAFPADGHTPTDLLRVADERMYACKRARQRARP